MASRIGRTIDSTQSLHAASMPIGSPMSIQMSTEARMVASVNIDTDQRSTAPMKSRQAIDTSATVRPAEIHATRATSPVKYHHGSQASRSARGSRIQRNTTAADEGGERVEALVDLQLVQRPVHRLAHGVLPGLGKRAEAQQVPVDDDERDEQDQAGQKECVTGDELPESARAVVAGDEACDALRRARHDQREAAGERGAQAVHDPDGVLDSPAPGADAPIVPGAGGSATPPGLRAPG